MVTESFTKGAMLEKRSFYFNEVFLIMKVTSNLPELKAGTL